MIRTSVCFLVKRVFTIILITMIICILIFGGFSNLSCKSSNGSAYENGQTTIALEEVIRNVFRTNPKPQFSYIISGFVKRIDSETLYIERINSPMVIANIDQGIRIETQNEYAERPDYKAILFKEILIGDAVELWVQIMSDGSFRQTRLLVNVQ